MNKRHVKSIVRIICALLALLMVTGFVVMLRPSAVEAYGGRYQDNMKVAIGISYGASAPQTYTVTSPMGFELGFVQQGDFFPLTETAEGKITVAAIAPKKYSVHIPIDESVADFKVQYGELKEIANELSQRTYMAFVGKGMNVRMGAFADRASAAKVCDTLMERYGVHAYPSEGTANDIYVLDGAGNIIFAFDCGTSLYFGIKGISPTSGKTYISAPDGYAYDGVLRFNRYNDSLTVVSVIGIEEYVAGVLPYEISSSWNEETQKAFAVCVRSYTLANLGKHNRAYGFDLCNSTDCQVYRGVTRITDTVRKCVASTKNMVLTYQGEPIGAYYSSSTGGCTAGAYDVWGGTSFPYLSAAATPWEKYTEHSGGSWTVEVTPTQLYEALKKKGYSGLTGNVASVKINSYAENSTYVNSITVTDVNGKSITINKCDKIRIALSSYVRSANFVVGKAGTKVKAYDYVSDTDESLKKTISGLKVRTVYGEKIVNYGGLLKTTSGSVSASGDVKVLTSTGTVPLSQVQGTVQCLPDLSKANVSRVEKTVELKGKNGNFVFVGRGYGHGVGMSQYGAKDLGDLGYTYDVILSSYFPKTEIKNMTIIK